MTRAPNRMTPALASMIVAGVDGVLFERGAGGDDLERRSRLVQILDRAIAAQLFARVAIGVRIEVGRVGERQDLAGARIHDDRRAAGRAARLHAGAQLALGDVLQVLVDRQLERRARGRRPLDAAERRAAARRSARAPCRRGRWISVS